MTTFANLRAGYPSETKAQLFNSMGGEWPKLINDPQYANTCCIRLSLAFGKAGIHIPSKYKEAITGAGEPLVIKVATMGTFLREMWGASSWGMSKDPGDDVPPDALPKKFGLLVYHAKWSNATGHFDLWDGKAFVGTGNFADMVAAYDLEFWERP